MENPPGRERERGTQPQLQQRRWSVKRSGASIRSESGRQEEGGPGGWVRDGPAARRLVCPSTRLRDRGENGGATVPGMLGGGDDISISIIGSHEAERCSTEYTWGWEEREGEAQGWTTSRLQRQIRVEIGDERFRVRLGKMNRLSDASTKATDGSNLSLMGCETFASVILQIHPCAAEKWKYFPLTWEIGVEKLISTLGPLK